MNSDTWLPTAPARVTLTGPPMNTESGLRMHANQTYIEAAQTADSGWTVFVTPCGCMALDAEVTELFPICRLPSNGGPASIESAISWLVILYAATARRTWSLSPQFISAQSLTGA